MNHETERIDLGNDAHHNRRLCARCTCGWLGDVVDSPNKVDDSIMGHEQQVRRDSTTRRGEKRVSLKTLLKHYTRMAEHPATPPRQRAQWETLSEEVRTRIAQTTVDHTTGQGNLFNSLEEA